VPKLWVIEKTHTPQAQANRLVAATTVEARACTKPFTTAQLPDKFLRVLQLPNLVGIDAWCLKPVLINMLPVPFSTLLAAFPRATLATLQHLSLPPHTSSDTVALLNLPQLTFLAMDGSAIGCCEPLGFAGVRLSDLRGLPRLKKLSCVRTLVGSCIGSSDILHRLPPELGSLRELTLVGFFFRRTILANWVRLSTPLRQLTYLNITRMRTFSDTVANAIISPTGPGFCELDYFSLADMATFLAACPLVQVLVCDFEDLMLDARGLATMLLQTVPHLRQFTLCCQSRPPHFLHTATFMELLPPSVFFTVSVHGIMADAFRPPSLCVAPQQEQQQPPDNSISTIRWSLRVDRNCAESERRFVKF